MDQSFLPEDFIGICDQLCTIDQELKMVINAHGYPVMWSRPNTFASVIHIILEQQVSLASALAALHKLKEKVLEITPAAILSLTDEEFKSCYFSRQKMVYARHLAQALLEERVILTELTQMSNEEIRLRLSELKGIGNWTVDVYLIFVLQRKDIFPVGDLAAVNALKNLKKLPKESSREQLICLAEQWQPYRTIATMILWHYYLICQMKKR